MNRTTLALTTLLTIAYSAAEAQDRQSVTWQNHKSCTKVDTRGCTGNSGKLCYVAPEKFYVIENTTKESHRIDGKKGWCTTTYENAVSITAKLDNGITVQIDEPTQLCAVAHVESGSGGGGINDTYSAHCNYAFDIQRYLPE